MGAGGYLLVEIFLSTFPSSVSMLLNQVCAIPREPHACQDYEVQLHRCWAPLPSFGGLPCALPDPLTGLFVRGQEPVAFGGACSQSSCADAGLVLEVPNLAVPLVNCSNARHRSFTCGYLTYREFLRPDDFAPCCSDDFPGTGLCIAGRCFPKPVAPMKKQD